MMACGTQLGCTIILVIVILVVCYTSTGSLNPLDVYTRGSTATKTAVSVIAVVGILYILASITCWDDERWLAGAIISLKR